VEQVDQSQFLLEGRYHVQSKKWWGGLGVTAGAKVKVKAAVICACKVAVEEPDIEMKERLKVRLKIATHKSRIRMNVR
jgi:hypothetical protein